MSAVLSGNIHGAMRAVALALRTDDGSKNVETYWQYLQCINMIVHTLVQDISAQGVQTFSVSSFTEKYVKLGQQCLERLEALIEKIGDEPPATPPPEYTTMPYQAWSHEPASQSENATSQPSQSQHATSHPAASPRSQSPASTPPPSQSASAIPPRDLPPRPRDLGPGPRDQAGQDLWRHLPVPPRTSPGPRPGPPAPPSRPPVGAGPSRSATSPGTGGATSGRSRNQLARSRSIELSLSLQRKLMENAEIAKARKAALRKKMLEQQSVLEAEAKKKFTSAEDQAFYAQVSKYEQTAVWPLAWRSRLSQTPEDERLIQLLIQQILRSPDHPLTAEIIKQRYDLYSRISPLILPHLPRLDKVKVVAMEEDVTDGADVTEGLELGQVTSELTSESSDDFVKVEKEEIEVPKFTPVRGSPVNVADFKDLSLPDSIFDEEGADEGTIATEDPTSATEDPTLATESPTISKGTQEIATDMGSDESANTVTSQDSSHVAAGNQTIATDTIATDGHNVSITKSESDNTVTVTYSPVTEHRSQPSTPDVIVTEAIATDVSMVTEVLPEFGANLRSSLQLVHTSLAQLQHWFVVAYQQLDTPGGRQQVALCVEDVVFQQLWQYVITLFRLSYLDKELSLSRLMTRYYGCAPQDFGVRDKFTLMDSDGEDSFIPYHKAVTETQRVIQLQSPRRKLEALVSVSVNICKAVDEHLAGGDAGNSIGADDLIPILAYVIVQAGQPQIVSECAALEEFIHEDFLFGEEGYALASFSACLAHLLSLEKDLTDD